MKPVTPTRVLGTLALGLLAVAITAATFYALIIPEYRNATFYQVLVACGVAELVFFGYLAFYLGAGSRGADPGQAVRARVLLLLAWWTLAIIVSGAVAVAPKFADSFYSDKILIWQLIGTFFVVAGGFYLQTQQAALAARTAEPERQRALVQSYALGMDPLLELLEGLARKRPQRAVELEGLRKRADTLRSQLRASLPRAERVEGRIVEPAPAEDLEARLRDVHTQVQKLAAASEEALLTEIEQTRAVIDQAIAASRHRQNAATF